MKLQRLWPAMRFLSPRFALVAALMTSARLDAADLAPQDRDRFEQHIRPTLVGRCIRCHGDTKQESGLRLTSLAGLLTGGDSGPAIVPGKPDESLLIEALRYASLEMPPDGKLDLAAIDAIEAWVAAGAPWPEGVELQPAPKITDRDRDWWCFQPLADPAVPEVADDGWCRNEIDQFVLARLATAGLSPAAEAEPSRLVRRVHYAVTGLPPDSAAARACADGSVSYEALVDRLLDEPAYGENQARYWLDLVRYADSDGYRADHPRPQAKLYRDYVIRSFQHDKPYDQFVIEQLAGDEVDPGNRDAVIATMYLRHWIYEWNQRDVELQWQEILSDVTETTADVFLALGIKCARCHDHKFDPLLQLDYYRLQGFFAALQPREDLPVADLAAKAVHHEQLRAWEDATEAIRRRLHEIENPTLLAHTTKEGFEKFVPEIKSMVAMRPSERNPYEQQIATLAARQFDVHPDKLAEWLDEPTESERQQLRGQLAEFDALKPSPLPTQAFVASDVGPVAPPTCLPGDPERRPIEPGYPTLLAAGPAEIVPPPLQLQSTGRRTALARWIANRDNPLTARVMVNRIWQQYFGRGLVEPASDFGQLGTPPSHPELLDWLTSRFIEEDWSLKKLQRRILTSATYRQSSAPPDDQRPLEVDPGNVLLWRMNPRRLSGEEIIDTVLTATGELATAKRAIYKPVLRNKPDPLLALFDFPDRIQSHDRRHRTTTSMQALMLMNNPWSHERAAALSARLLDAAAPDFVRLAYQQLIGREPDAFETEQAERFLAAYVAAQSSPEQGATPSGDSARAALVHALLNSNELIYVD